MRGELLRSLPSKILKKRKNSSTLNGARPGIYIYVQYQKNILRIYIFKLIFNDNHSINIGINVQLMQTHFYNMRHEVLESWLVLNDQHREKIYFKQQLIDTYILLRLYMGDHISFIFFHITLTTNAYKCQFTSFLNFMFLLSHPKTKTRCWTAGGKCWCWCWTIMASFMPVLDRVCL